MMTKILRVAPGAIFQVENSLQSLKNLDKIFCVSDSLVDGLYGDSVKERLNSICRVKESNTIAYAMSVAERVIATDIDCIVGLGGGRVLDVCKYATYIAKKPFVSIPTTMANDGIVSPIAVLKRQDKKTKSLGCAAPTILLVDTKLIMDGSIQLIKSGIGYTTANYMALKDWTFAVERGKDQIHGYAYLMSQTALDVMMKIQYQSMCQEVIDVLARSLALSGYAMEYADGSHLSVVWSIYSVMHWITAVQIKIFTVFKVRLEQYRC